MAKAVGVSVDGPTVVGFRVVGLELGSPAGKVGAKVVGKTVVGLSVLGI